MNVNDTKEANARLVREVDPARRLVECRSCGFLRWQTSERRCPHCGQSGAKLLNVTRKGRGTRWNHCEPETTRSLN